MNRRGNSKQCEHALDAMDSWKAHPHRCGAEGGRQDRCSLVEDDQKAFEGLLEEDLAVNNPQNFISRRGATASRNSAGLISRDSSADHAAEFCVLVRSGSRLCKNTRQTNRFIGTFLMFRVGGDYPFRSGTPLASSSI